MSLHLAVLRSESGRGWGLAVWERRCLPGRRPRAAQLQVRAGEGNPERLARPLLTVPGRCLCGQRDPPAPRGGVTGTPAAHVAGATGNRRGSATCFKTSSSWPRQLFLITWAGLRPATKGPGWAIQGGCVPIGTPLPFQAGDIPRVVPYCSQPTRETPLGNEGPQLPAGHLLPCFGEAVGSQARYYREHATCRTPARGGREPHGSDTNTPFNIVLQQMLMEAEVSSQEGCVGKVGELLRAFSGLRRRRPRAKARAARCGGPPVPVIRAGLAFVVWAGGVAEQRLHLREGCRPGDP